MRSVDEKIPTTVTEAKWSPEWDKQREAMKNELESLQRHQVWDLVNRPKTFFFLIKSHKN